MQAQLVGVAQNHAILDIFAQLGNFEVIALLHLLSVYCFPKVIYFLVREAAFCELVYFFHSVDYTDVGYSRTIEHEIGLFSDIFQL